MSNWALIKIPPSLEADRPSGNDRTLPRFLWYHVHKSLPCPPWRDC